MVCFLRHSRSLWIPMKPPTNSNSEAAQGSDLMPPRVPISSRPKFRFQAAQELAGPKL
jgi:hypothetical protein